MKKEVFVPFLLMGLIAFQTSIFNVTSTKSNPKTGIEVTQIGEMSVERAAHQATLLTSGQVLITGGCAGHSCEKILLSAELYDPSSRSFHSVSPMNTPRASHTAAALPNGQVLVAGGWSGKQATASAEIYDPETDEWKPIEAMSTSRESPIAVSLPDSSVFVMSGGTGRLENLTIIEVFDPATATFSVAGKSSINHYLATALADGRVLMTGGQDNDGNIHNRASIFDPATGEIQETGSMQTPRVKHAATLLNDGRILVMGGSDSQGYRGRYTSTEIYDPESGEFSMGPNMFWGRHKINDAVTLLPSGEVLVAGGADKPEIFDPVHQNFSVTEDQLSGPQMFTTATLLHDGNVLVLGGYDERIQTSASAWSVQVGN